MVSALAKAHQSRGNLCEIFLPKYDHMDYSQVVDLREMVDISTPWKGAAVLTVSGEVRRRDYN